VSDTGRWRGRLARVREVGAAGVARRVRDRLGAPRVCATVPRSGTALQAYRPARALARCGLPVDQAGLPGCATPSAVLLLRPGRAGHSPRFASRHPDARGRCWPSGRRRGDLGWGARERPTAPKRCRKLPLRIVPSGAIDYGGERPPRRGRLGDRSRDPSVRLGQASWLCAIRPQGRPREPPPRRTPNIAWPRREVALRAIALPGVPSDARPRRLRCRALQPLAARHGACRVQAKTRTIPSHITISCRGRGSGTARPRPAGIAGGRALAGSARVLGEIASRSRRGIRASTDPLHRLRLTRGRDASARRTRWDNGAGSTRTCRRDG
jgi:hypothetical protein